MKARLALLSLILFGLSAYARQEVDELVGVWKSGVDAIELKADGTLIKGDQRGKWRTDHKGGIEIEMATGTTGTGLGRDHRSFEYDGRVYRLVGGGAPEPVDPAKPLAIARTNQSIAEWSLLITFIFLALLCLYAAGHTYFKGFKVSANSTLTGTPAAVLAVVFALLGVGFLVWGILLFRGGLCF